jgi:hypothetical protein
VSGLGDGRGGQGGEGKAEGLDGMKQAAHGVLL